MLDGHIDPTSERHACLGCRATKAHVMNAMAMNALFCAPSEIEYTLRYQDVLYLKWFDNSSKLHIKGHHKWKSSRLASSPPNMKHSKCKKEKTCMLP